MSQRTAAGESLVVPSLLLAEVAGAIARRAGRPQVGQQAMVSVLHVPGLRVVALDAVLGREAGRLAARLQLRGADAVYVAVARALSLPLVTWDVEVQKRAAGIVIVRTPGN
ncbi:MAG: type II toxin-antitoxin system VapC family toxin [Chloroflexi bacterium]|nr:type II toxin-antitoxin system VapC family toxin [Chloroflexota bacterium]